MPPGACTPTNDCHIGSRTCATDGTCADTGTPVADGTACATNGGNTCNAGTCVVSSAVTGTRFLQLTSSNADVHDLLVGDPLATLTAGTLSEDWFATATGSRKLNLLSGDDLYVNRLASQPIGTLTVPYLASASTTVLPATTVTDLTGATLAPALAAPATTSTSVDWRTTQFAALLTSVNAGAAGAGQALAVEASAHPLASTAPLGTGAPALLNVSVGTTQPDLTPAASVGYGQLPAPWTEFRRAELSAQMTYTVGATPFTLTATIGQREAMPTAATPIIPLLGPVGAPTVSTTPATVISWNAPAIGTPSRYSVSIYRLDPNLSTSTVLAATFTTSGTTVAVPSGILTAGTTYVAAIEARNVTGGDAFATAPFRSSILSSYATALTDAFIP